MAYFFAHNFTYSCALNSTHGSSFVDALKCTNDGPISCAHSNSDECTINSTFIST